MNLALVGNYILRSAIQRNLVSFPSQIPAFRKHGDSQKRVVQLYFVRRWRIKAICDRYGLSKATVQHLLSEWRIRAVSAGYVQEIHPETLAMLAHEDDVRRGQAFEESEPDAGAQSGWEMAPFPQSGSVECAAVRQ
jgi:hypothetical protein